MRRFLILNHEIRKFANVSTKRFSCHQGETERQRLLFIVIYQCTIPTKPVPESKMDLA